MNKKYKSFYAFVKIHNLAPSHMLLRPALRKMLEPKLGARKMKKHPPSPLSFQTHEPLTHAPKKPLMGFIPQGQRSPMTSTNQLPNCHTVKEETSIVSAIPS